MPPPRVGGTYPGAFNVHNAASGRFYKSSMWTYHVPYVRVLVTLQGFLLKFVGITNMLENFDFFRVTLAPALWSAQIYKKIVSASQLGTYEIRAGMCPATLHCIHIVFLRMFCLEVDKSICAKTKKKWTKLLSSLNDLYNVYQSLPNEQKEFACTILLYFS
jgi:hypothetical protein